MRSTLARLTRLASASTLDFAVGVYREVHVHRQAEIVQLGLAGEAAVGWLGPRSRRREWRSRSSWSAASDAAEVDHDLAGLAVHADVGIDVDAGGGRVGPQRAQVELTTLDVELQARGSGDVQVAGGVERGVVPDLGAAARPSSSGGLPLRCTRASAGCSSGQLREQGARARRGSARGTSTFKSSASFSQRTTLPNCTSPM